MTLHGIGGVPDLFRVITESVLHMVWTAAPDGTVEYINSCVLEYTGLGEGELRAGGWARLYHPDDLPVCVQRWKRALETGESFVADYRLRRSDGEYRWHRHVVQNLRDGDGRIVRWFGTCTDIEVERRAVHDAEIRFRLFMDNLPMIAWIKDSRLRLTWVNREYERRRGKPLEEILDKDDFEWRAEHLARKMREQDEEVLRMNAPMQYMNLLPQSGGPDVCYLAVKFPLPDELGELGVAGVAVDVTESQQLERTVRALLKRLVEAQEAERRSVAADLHDLVGQKLTALGISLDILRGQLPSDEAARLLPRLGQMSSLVEETIADIREVMSELRPPALEEHGLTAALFQYAEAFGARTGMQVRVSGPDGIGLLSRDAEIAMFRIVQEALTNAAKHSGASQVEVRIGEGAGGVRLQVEDNGRGIVLPAAIEREGGWGLRAMRERADAVGGRFAIESTAGGARIVVTIPSTRGD